MRSITHVRKNDRGHIALLFVEGIGARTRHDVIEDIDLRRVAHQTKRSTPHGVLCADVSVVTVNGVKWLRTDRNGVAADNLGELPTF